MINLFRNEEARPSAAVVFDVLRQKCEHKGIPVPTLADLGPHRDSLEGSWKHMLDHQLPSLPPLTAFWDALPALFEWLASGNAPMVRAASSVGAGETVLRTRVLGLPMSSARQSCVEVIRFAAANRLLVEVDYRDREGRRSTRAVEAYSLARTSAGEIVLHVHDRTRDAHRSLRVDRIEGARVTDQSFIPRYQIELTATAPVRSTAPESNRSS